jgi:hypothetical protein
VVSDGRVREGTGIVEGVLTSLRLRKKEKKRKKEMIRRLNTHDKMSSLLECVLLHLSAGVEKARGSMIACLRTFGT